MRIAVWCSMVSIGGGVRLLSQLLPAIARQKDIELVRLVISKGSNFKENNTILSPNMEVVYYDGFIDTNEGAMLIKDIHVVYYFWPHTQEYRPIDRPTVCTFHDSVILDYVPPFTSGSSIRDYWEKSKNWLQKCNYVVVSSEAVKTSLINHFGNHLNSAIVIPHAILPTNESKSNYEMSLSLRNQLPKEFFLYPSNTSPHKNHYNLILAYSMFSKKDKYPLVLTGYLTEELRKVPPEWPEISYLPTLVSLIKRKGLKIDQDIYPIGYVGNDDIIPIVKNAKAVIMPSLSEGGGSYPVEEALRLGVPVLCSDIPVMREHLSRHSAEVVWFNPESPDSIVLALEELTENYNKYKKSAIEGMDDSTETWDDIARKYIHVFRLAYIKFYGL